MIRFRFNFGQGAKASTWVPALHVALENEEFYKNNDVRVYLDNDINAVYMEIGTPSENAEDDLCYRFDTIMTDSNTTLSNGISSYLEILKQVTLVGDSIANADNTGVNKYYNADTIRELAEVIGSQIYADKPDPTASALFDINNILVKDIIYRYPKGTLSKQNLLRKLGEVEKKAEDKLASINEDAVNKHQKEIDKVGLEAVINRLTDYRTRQVSLVKMIISDVEDC